MVAWSDSRDRLQTDTLCYLSVSQCDGGNDRTAIYCLKLIQLHTDNGRIVGCKSCSGKLLQRQSIWKEVKKGKNQGERTWRGYGRRSGSLGVTIRRETIPFSLHAGLSYVSLSQHLNCFHPQTLNEGQQIYWTFVCLSSGRRLSSRQALGLPLRAGPPGPQRPGAQADLVGSRLARARRGRLSLLPGL